MVCICSFESADLVDTIAYMHRSTDTQTFSSFAALNRADLTHEPEEKRSPWICKFVIVGVVLVAALRLIVG